MSLDRAFLELGYRGYIVDKGNFHCSVCGWQAIMNKFHTQNYKAVFYSSQDESHFDKNRFMFLNWSGDGNFITEVLKKHGVDTEWNGSDDKRIIVKKTNDIETFVYNVKCCVPKGVAPSSVGVK